MTKVLERDGRTTGVQLEDGTEMEEYSFEEMKGIEYQVMATDICCYAFPRNIERVIQGVGKGEPVTNFEGCGTANGEIETFIRGEFRRLYEWLDGSEAYLEPTLDNRGPEKTWLVACLAKTLKAQIRLSDPIARISDIVDAG